MRRDELLDAAERLLAGQGAQALTLAAVAEEAGVSKGGLLYHFSNKDALIHGMIERLITDFDELVAQQKQASYTKRYICATIASVRSGQMRRWAVVTGAAGDPSLLQPLREAMVRWHTEGLDEEPDQLAAQIVRLACEGIWDVSSHAPDLHTAEHLRELELRLLALLG
jgi:AcrR family transcriptional regulator